MKIYKMAQTTSPNPAAQKEIQDAQGQVMGCIQVLNTNIQIIEQNQHVADILTNRENLITAIKSGNTRDINRNVIENVLKSMSLILATIPTLHASIDTLQSNNADVHQLNQTIEVSLRQGKVIPSNFQNVFVSNLPANSNIGIPSNLSQ